MRAVKVIRGLFSVRQNHGREYFAIVGFLKEEYFCPRPPPWLAAVALAGSSGSESECGVRETMDIPLRFQEF